MSKRGQRAQVLSSRSPRSTAAAARARPGRRSTRGAWCGGCWWLERTGRPGHTPPPSGQGMSSAYSQLAGLPRLAIRGALHVQRGPHHADVGHAASTVGCLALGRSRDTLEGEEVRAFVCRTRRFRMAGKKRKRGKKGGGKARRSRYVGVSWRKAKQKWSARVYVAGVGQHLGYFDDEADGARAYDAAVVSGSGHSENLIPNSSFFSLCYFFLHLSTTELQWFYPC